MPNQYRTNETISLQLVLENIQAVAKSRNADFLTIKQYNASPLRKYRYNTIRALLQMNWNAMIDAAGLKRSRGDGVSRTLEQTRPASILDLPYEEPKDPPFHPPQHCGHCGGHGLEPLRVVTETSRCPAIRCQNCGWYTGPGWGLHPIKESLQELTPKQLERNKAFIANIKEVARAYKTKQLPLTLYYKSPLRRFWYRGQVFHGMNWEEMIKEAGLENHTGRKHNYQPPGQYDSTIPVAL